MRGSPQIKRGNRYHILFRNSVLQVEIDMLRAQSSNWKRMIPDSGNQFGAIRGWISGYYPDWQIGGLRTDCHQFEAAA